MLPAGLGEGTEVEVDLAWGTVDQRSERHHPTITHALDQALHKTAMKPTHQVRTNFGKLPERAMGERHSRLIAVDADRRVEADGGQLRGQRVEATGSLRPGLGVSVPLIAARLRGFLSAGAGSPGDAEQEASQQRERRRFEPERRRAGGNGVQMLGSAHATAGIGPYLEQANIAHPLEVGPHRVRVQVQRVGDVRSGQRKRGPSQFEIDGVAGVVAQGLEDGQSVGSRSGARPRWSSAILAVAISHTPRLHGRCR